MQREKIRVALCYRGPQHEGRDDFSSFVPVGLFHILKSLLASGYDASLHNLSILPAKRMAEAVAATDASAVLISAFYGCHHEAFALARAAKKALPRAVVGLGGPLAVLAPAILARVPEIDWVVRGEGEEAVVALLDSHFLGVGDPAGIPGAVFRGPFGIREVAPRLLEDIDRHFFMPSEVLPRCHQVQPENLAVLISSRGCPFHCTFCSSTVLWRNRVRHHRPELLVRYLKDLRANTGALYFSLRDENFLVNRDHVRAFTRELAAARLHFLWNAQGSPHLIDSELAAELASAGCDQLQMGIEALAPRLRAMLGKKGDPAGFGPAITALRNQAIRPFGYFIYGMGESREEGQASLDFIRKSGLLDAVASPLVLYPGTELATGVAEERFWGKGELLFHSPDSQRQWRERYDAALAELAGRGDFSGAELRGAPAGNAVSAVASHFHHLRRGELDRAEQCLARLVASQPDNPWGYDLLARFHAETGQRAKAKAMRQRLASLLQ
ncbi:MAG: radical SAM protein [Thermodesulfobacteriota bacterium]